MLKLNIKLLVLDKPARLIVRLFFTYCLFAATAAVSPHHHRQITRCSCHCHLLPAMSTYKSATGALAVFYNGNVNQFTRQISPRCTTQVLTRTIAGIIDRWRISLDFANSLLTDFK